MPGLIIETFILAFSSYIFARKFFGRRLFSDFCLIWFILFFAQIVLVELALGIAGRFYFRNVFLSHLFVLVLALYSWPKDLSFTLPKPYIGDFLESKLLILSFSLFCGFFLVKGYLNLINPPLSPDSLQGHLAFPATWIMHGNLDNRLCIFGAAPVVNPGSLETTAGTYYPINAQLFFAWFMLPLKNAFLADLGEAPFYFIGIIAVYSILRKYDVSRKTALLSGFLWTLIPNIFKQLRTASQVDIICAVLFLLVFYSLLLLKSEFNLPNAVIFGITTGLFAGTKEINLVWLAAFSPFILYILLKGLAKPRLDLPKALSLLGFILLAFFLFSSYMYLKNFYYTGNPLFPVDVKIFGKTIFKGLIDNAAYRVKIASGDGFDFMRIAFHEGLGLQFLALILPGMFLSLLFLFYLRKKMKPFWEFTLIATAPFFMLAAYNYFVNIYVVRYIFVLLSMGMITVVIFLSRLPWGEKYLSVVAFFAVLASASELAKGQELVASLLLFLLIFAVLLVYKRQALLFYEKKKDIRVLFFAFLAAAVVLTYLNKKYDREEYIRYPLTFSKKESRQKDIGNAWKALNDITKQGARVAYTGRQEVYPLFGTRLKNEVKYISINEKEALPYNEPDGLYRQVKDYQAWRNNLSRERMEFLFIAQPFPINREYDDLSKFTIEEEWASSHPEDFRLLFSNSLARIYQINNNR